jgi:hypothetical protein
MNYKRRADTEYTDVLVLDVIFLIWNDLRNEFLTYPCVRKPQDQNLMAMNAIIKKDEVCGEIKLSFRRIH